MAVPDYETLMLPVLRALADGRTLSARQLRERVAEDVGLSEADRAETIPSGAPVFDNRVHWAVTYMVQAGLLARPRRGAVELTDRGREVGRVPKLV